LKCFVRLSKDNILQARQRFCNSVHVSRLVECQSKMVNVQGDQEPAKSRKCGRNWRNLPRRPLLNNPWVHRHRGDQLWSLPGGLNSKFQHAPHCRKVCSLNLGKWWKAASYEHVSWARTEEYWVPNFYL
jgi:hypothetical protein